jgi:ferric iron reductase protein FhuF
MQAVLDEVAGIGPFFALATEGTGRPVRSFYADGFLARAIARISTAETRVAASLAQQDFAARLWSPVLACGLIGSIVPDMTSLFIFSNAQSPQVELGLARLTGWRAENPAEVARLSYRVVVEEHLKPLVEALSPVVAPRLLWGNAASALVGALTVIVMARPELRPAAAGVASTLLETGALAGTGALFVMNNEFKFRRNSCCLYYRLPGKNGALCGDCSLRQ